MAESGKDVEALEHLRLAAPEIPRALLLSAHIEIRMGPRQAASAGLREYLKNRGCGRQTPCGNLVVATGAGRADKIEV